MADCDITPPEVGDFVWYRIEGGRTLQAGRVLEIHPDSDRILVDSDGDALSIRRRWVLGVQRSWLSVGKGSPPADPSDADASVEQ